MKHLQQFVHPSEEIFVPDQLVGRDAELTKILGILEAKGTHPFVTGPRGVGKTSLVHTACAKYKDIGQGAHL